MNAVEKLALTKIKIPAAREAVKPGQYNVRCTFTMIGTLTVGNDYLITPTSTLPPLYIISIAMQYMTVAERKRFIAYIERAAVQAFETAGGTPSEGRKFSDGVTSDAITRTIETVRARLQKTLPKVKHAGKVTYRLKITSNKK